MAETQENVSSLSKGDSNPPKIRLTEIGTTGLSTSDGDIREQVRKELRWPKVITTYKQMMNDPMISAGVRLIEMMIAKIKWDVQAPMNATPEQEKKALFIKQCMDDMEHPWHNFISDILSYISYGFCVQEKVYRKRSKKNGSKYNDNLIGWRKLAPRSQDTIGKWKWSDDGRNLEAVYQDLTMVDNEKRFSFYFNSQDKKPKGLKIPRDKFLLFRYDPKRDNPLGNSPLNACFVPWKFRVAIEEAEAIGVSRDMTGMPILGLHPKYMSPDATPEDQAIYDYYKNVIRNIHNNEQAGLIYPLMYNDAGKKIIEFDLMAVQGGKQYDTDKIIKRYDDKILTALFADILKLGQDTHGSFSLAGAKTNIVAVNIESRLKEIAEVLNNDLIPQTFKLNGWDDQDLPKFIYEDLDEEDYDEFGKLIQRIASVNFLPRNQSMVSQIVKRSGFEGWEDLKDMSDDDFEELFTSNESGSGEGLGTSGTGSSQNGGSNSDTNSDNAS